MEKINLSLCELSDWIPVGPNDELDDNFNGEYGYRVFYEVPKSEIDRLGVFKDLDEIQDLEEGEDYCGELEFTVDENGNQDGEILLWCAIVDECGTSNIEFVDYEHDVDELVNDFNNRQMEKGDR